MLVTQTMIASAYEPACGGSASVHNYGVMPPNPVLLSDMTEELSTANWRASLSWMTRRFSTLMVTRMSWLRRKRLAELTYKDFCFGVMR